VPYLSKSINVSGYTTYSFSLWVKDIDMISNGLQIRIREGSGVTHYARLAYTFSNNQISETEGGAFSFTSSSIEEYSNGWKRLKGSFSINTATLSSYTSLRYEIYYWSFSTVDQDYGSFYVWGAQLEPSDSVTDYIATDPNPVTRTTTESLGLLVEEQRANYLLYSEDYLSSTNTVQATVTPNTQISPDGTQTADTITADNIPSTQHGSNKQSSSLPANSTIALSVFVKAGTTSYVKLDTSNTTNWSQNAGIAVDLSNGNIITGTGEVKEYPNGWWRITVYGVTNSSTSVPRGLWVWISNASGASVISTSGTETIYVWGAQAEVGSFPTSYIPTSGSAITRPKDVATIELDKTAALYNNDEGTFFSESVANCTLPANNYGGVFGVGSSTAITNFFYFNPSNATGYYASNITQVPAMTLGRAYVNGQRYSFAGGYSNSGFSLSKDGDITSNTSTGILNGTGVKFSIGTNPINQGTWGTQVIRKVSYYPKKLTNAQLQTLTK